ncbi:MAG: hypothetical protein AAB426_09970 [Myxococcota bacterium]
MRRIAALVVLVTVTHASHLALEKRRPAGAVDLRETLPSVEALQLLSLSYASLVADYYWLKAISQFGTTEMHTAGYPNLVGLMERVLALDPYFATAYDFAGTALTVKGLDPRASVTLLEQGLRYRPDSWRIAFYLGFNAFFFLGDNNLAASAMARAARVPGSPPMVAMLATRLAAEAGKPEVGLALTEALLETITEPTLRTVYEERRDLLRLEVELAVLHTAAERYQTIVGRSPRTLEDLVRPGILRTLPTHDPVGGRYFLDVRSEVRTTSESKRLRLYRPQRGEGDR